MITIRRIQTGESQLYRLIRLQALKEAPHAFCASYENALLRDDASWQEQADGSAQGVEQAIFIAFDNDKPVGMAAIYKDEENADEAEIFQVWVSPATRGTGLGKRLLDTVFDWATRSGYSRIIATIIHTNKDAIGFYASCGFEKKSESAEQTKMIMATRARPPADATNSASQL